VTDYLNSPRFDGEFSVFWRLPANQAKYSLLLPIAEKFLSAPMTSAESERLFSAAKLITTNLRKSLSVENLQMLLFVHQNMTVLGCHDIL
jgi:hypothetical protein